MAQCSMTSVRWKYYACGAQSWRKIWKPAERPVGICQLPSVSLWAGSELSVGRGRAFSFSLLPLSWRSFSSVQGFLHGTAWSVFILDACTGLKTWYLTSSKSRVSLDDGVCALLGLLVTKTPRRHSSSLQERLCWLGRLNSTNTLCFACLVG